ncbi:hypothetical protein AVEN_39782-1 [Araneus ventricosus]|uniref:Uncharacterized protein n=1 Tax=Araneus ventricosus TaxID=182803 RepID=A0A4Y2MJ98_ARAVE|nr:hypothetical protein AVEN_39782-1 [Araneus ventricosus]
MKIHVTSTSNEVWQLLTNTVGYFKELVKLAVDIRDVQMSIKHGFLEDTGAPLGSGLARTSRLEPLRRDFRDGRSTFMGRSGETHHHFLKLCFITSVLAFQIVSDNSQTN